MRNAGDGGKGERTNEMKRRYSPGERMETEKEERERERRLFVVTPFPSIHSYYLSKLDCLFA